MGEGEKRVNYEVAKRDFKFYVYDWDDNILHMSTRINMERRDDETGEWKPVAVSTSLYAVARQDRAHYRFPAKGGMAEAFRDFNDPEDPSATSAFLRDTNAALDLVAAGERPGPCFETLRKTLREGRIFAIVTVRGHAPATVRKAVETFIDRALTPEDREEMMANLRGYRWWLDGKTEFGTDAEELDHYLSVCRYHAVSHPRFSKRVAGDAHFGGRYEEAVGSAKNEVAKEFAIQDFVEHLFHVLERTGGLGRPVSVGFSDDDPGNVKAVSDFIRAELSRRFGGFKFVVYDTSDPTIAHGRKVMVAGQLT